MRDLDAASAGTGRAPDADEKDNLSGEQIAMVSGGLGAEYIILGF